jgi:hypothetical protein
VSSRTVSQVENCGVAQHRIPQGVCIAAPCQSCRKSARARRGGDRTAYAYREIIKCPNRTLYGSPPLITPSCRSYTAPPSPCEDEHPRHPLLTILDPAVLDVLYRLFGFESTRITRAFNHYCPTLRRQFGRSATLLKVQRNSSRQTHAIDQTAAMLHALRNTGTASFVARQHLLSRRVYKGMCRIGPSGNHWFEASNIGQGGFQRLASMAATRSNRHPPFPFV